jgi:hypothetical protein
VMSSAALLASAMSSPVRSAGEPGDFGQGD